MATPGPTAGSVRAAGRPQRLRLGDILVAQKTVSQEQLRIALDEQKRTGRRLGRVLVEMGFSTEEEIARALARQRSEEHTSELQSPDHLVCRLLLEKKKTKQLELYCQHTTEQS